MDLSLKRCTSARTQLHPAQPRTSGPLNTPAMHCQKIKEVSLRRCASLTPMHQHSHALVKLSGSACNAEPQTKRFPRGVKIPAVLAPLYGCGSAYDAWPQTKEFLECTQAGHVTEQHMKKAF
eukprot:1160090-Pelagomonas_calceolata.AAC.6